jgi:hypoxanthine phosphoribosyltransferase
MSASLEHIKQVRAEADCLATIEQAELALDDIAAAITARHKNNNPLIVCVMNGFC